MALTLLYNESTKAFTLAGSGSGGLMTIARSGPSATLISGSGTALDGQGVIGAETDETEIWQRAARAPR